MGVGAGAWTLSHLWRREMVHKVKIALKIHCFRPLIVFYFNDL